MITNTDDKQMEIEQRDMNYILTAYLRMYLFQSRNAEPDRIVMPMFSSAPHPYEKGKVVPITYVPEISIEAQAIAQDGSNVPMTTPESEAEADRKEAEYNQMIKRIEELETELKRARAGDTESVADQEEAAAEEPPVSKARQALAAQMEQGVVPEPEKPEKPVEMQTDYGSKPDPRVSKQVAKDLMPERDIKEEDEKEDGSFVDRAKRKQ